MTMDSISIALNLCAFGAAILLLALSMFSVNLKERVHLWFLINVVCVFMSFMFDLGIELLLGNPGAMGRILIRVFDCLSYSVAGFQIVAFTWYLYEYLNLKATVTKKPFIIMSAIGAINILMAIIAFFTDLYTRLDEYNNYIRQPTFWLSELCFIFLVFQSLWIVSRHMKVLKVREWVSLALYVLGPLVCYVFEVMIPNFYIALFGATCTAALIYINIQADLTRQMQLKEAELAENRIAMMLSQIQPHFLYNLLASIEYLCEIDGAERAASAVQDFSEYLRGNMDSLTQKGPVLFTHELQHTNLYLSLEKRRFGDRIQTVYDTPVTDFLLPALTLQPVVENAVRHGITKRDEGGAITVRSFEDEEFWYISVRDNGVGFDTAERKHDGRSHVGIENVRNRLKAMCGGTLEIVSRPGTGTTATISIPKKQEVTDREYHCGR